MMELVGLILGIVTIITGQEGDKDWLNKQSQILNKTSQICVLAEEIDYLDSKRKTSSESLGCSHSQCEPTDGISDKI